MTIFLSIVSAVAICLYAKVRKNNSELVGVIVELNEEVTRVSDKVNKLTEKFIDMGRKASLSSLHKTLQKNEIYFWKESLKVVIKTMKSDNDVSDFMDNSEFELQLLLSKVREKFVEIITDQNVDQDLIDGLFPNT